MYLSYVGKVKGDPCYAFTNTHGQRFIHIQYLAFFIIMNDMYVYVQTIVHVKLQIDGSNTYTFKTLHILYLHKS